MEATTINTPADYRLEWASKREREWVERNLAISHAYAHGKIDKREAAARLAQSTVRFIFGRETGIDSAALQGLTQQFIRELDRTDFTSDRA